MHMLIKNTTNNTIYIPCKNYTIFCKQSKELYLMELYLKFRFHKYFHYILQLIYQLLFFYSYNFYNLNVLQYHMIYPIHTHNYLDSK